MRSRLVDVVVWLAMVVAAAGHAACKKSSEAGNGGGGASAEGTERGACYGNGTCNNGLTCLSNLCVRPPGADCDKVAAKLSSLLLGNYAARDQRDAFLASTRDECTRASLTKEEGDCLLAVPHRNAFGTCPKVIGVGDCAKVVSHLDTLRKSSGDEFVVNNADKLGARCKNETPSKGLELCVLGARSIADLDRCVW